MFAYYRLVELRFINELQHGPGSRSVVNRAPITRFAAEEYWAPVGLFFRFSGKRQLSNVFINDSEKTPGLPLLLLWPRRIFSPKIDLNKQRIDRLRISPWFANDFRIGKCCGIQVPDGTPKIDKFLFTELIANHEKHRARRPIYRFSMPR